MAGLNDLIRSSTQGGSIAKPLMLGLGALLGTDRRRKRATDNGHE
jgi:hypothetical protein